MEFQCLGDFRSEANNVSYATCKNDSNSFLSDPAVNKPSLIVHQSSNLATVFDQLLFPFTFMICSVIHFDVRQPYLLVIADPSHMIISLPREKLSGWWCLVSVTRTTHHRKMSHILVCLKISPHIISRRLVGGRQTSKNL